MNEISASVLQIETLNHLSLLLWLILPWLPSYWFLRIFICQSSLSSCLSYTFISYWTWKHTGFLSSPFIHRFTVSDLYAPLIAVWLIMCGFLNTQGMSEIFLSSVLQSSLDNLTFWIHPVSSKRTGGPGELCVDKNHKAGVFSLNKIIEDRVNNVFKKIKLNLVACWVYSKQNLCFPWVSFSFFWHTVVSFLK